MLRSALELSLRGVLSSGHSAVCSNGRAVDAVELGVRHHIRMRLPHSRPAREPTRRSEWEYFFPVAVAVVVFERVARSLAAAHRLLPLAACGALRVGRRTGAPPRERHAGPPERRERAHDAALCGHSDTHVRRLEAAARAARRPRRRVAARWSSVTAHSSL